MVLLRATRAGRSASPFLSSFCQNCKLIVRKLHNSANVERIDTKCKFNKFQSDHCSGTMEDISKKINELIGLEIGFNTIPKCRANLLKFQPKAQDLPSRSMKDSFTTAVIPLSSASTQEHYINHLGRLRIGRITEELDMFAVWICYRHLKIPNLPKGVPMPHVIVTLLLDYVDYYRMHLINTNEDINICGFVSRTGNSAMEITLYVTQNFCTVAKAIIIMVARNATNTGPASVNPLKPACEEEQLCNKKAIERHQARKITKIKSGFNIRPTEEEEVLMYELFARTKGKNFNEVDQPKPPNSCWMSQSYQTTMLHAFPDHRNIYNTIFGGFVMRKATEISYVTACIYSGEAPQIECIMDVGFFSTIGVDSFIKFTAYVVYTYKKYMQIMCTVNAINASNYEQSTTSAFHITVKAKSEVKEVLPSTYQETLWYIGGRKKFLKFKSMREQPDHPLKSSQPCNLKNFWKPM